MLTEKFTLSPFGKTYYWVSKCDSSINLVFLPGLTADHRLFNKQVEYFEGKYNILVWDCPAHGKSRPYSEFNYTNVTTEMKTILDSERMERVVVIGQSLGGMLGQFFIHRFPDMADGYIAIDSCPFGDYYSKADLFWLGQIEWMCKLFPDKLLRESMAKVCGRTKAARENMMEMLSAYQKEELCHLMYIGEAAFIPENTKINIPCKALLLLGEKDRVGKVTSYCKEWAKREKYPLEIIRNAAHNSNVDQPELVNGLIERFVEGMK